MTRGIAPESQAWIRYQRCCTTARPPPTESCRSDPLRHRVGVGDPGASPLGGHPLGSKNLMADSRYIERPLLLFSGRKFDLRQWVMVRSFRPLKVYMFSSCYLSLGGVRRNPPKTSRNQTWLAGKSPVVGHSNGKIIELNEGCFFPCLTPRAYAENILKSSRVRFQASDATGSIFAFSTFLTTILDSIPALVVSPSVLIALPCQHRFASDLQNDWT